MVIYFYFCNKVPVRFYQRF